MHFKLKTSQEDTQRITEDPDFEDIDLNEFIKTLDKLKEEYNKDEYISPREELLLNFSIQCSNIILGFVKGFMRTVK